MPSCHIILAPFGFIKSSFLSKLSLTPTLDSHIVTFGDVIAPKKSLKNHCYWTNNRPRKIDTFCSIKSIIKLIHFPNTGIESIKDLIKNEHFFIWNQLIIDFGVKKVQKLWIILKLSFWIGKVDLNFQLDFFLVDQHYKFLK